MAIDWITTLQEEADFATRIAEDVNGTLNLPDLTATQAARLYQVVEEGLQTFDRILDEMEDHDIEDQSYSGSRIRIQRKSVSPSPSIQSYQAAKAEEVLEQLLARVLTLTKLRPQLGVGRVTALGPSTDRPLLTGNHCERTSRLLDIQLRQPTISELSLRVPEPGQTHLVGCPRATFADRMVH